MILIKSITSFAFASPDVFELRTYEVRSLAPIPIPSSLYSCLVSVTPYISIKLYTITNIQTIYVLITAQYSEYLVPN